MKKENKDLESLNNEDKLARERSEEEGYLCPDCGEPLTPLNDMGGICKKCYDKECGDGLE